MASPEQNNNQFSEHVRTFSENVEVLSAEISNLPFGPEIAALMVFLFFLILRSLFANIVISIARKLVKRTENSIDDELVEASEGPVKFLIVVFGLSIAFKVLGLPNDWHELTHSIIASLYTYCLFWLIFCMITPITLALFTMGHKLGRRVNEDFQHFARRTLEVVVFVIGGVAILEQWEINVSAFLGGIGLAGMAIALAAKDTVANLFGTLMIFTDKTFQKGDWIETPDVEGTIEFIGLRATKVRTFAKALVNVPNANLANSPITNWSRMTNRRIKMTIGVEYRTTAQQLENIVTRIRNFIETNKDVEPKANVAQMVHLTEFADNSININLYYFTKTTNWEEWRQIRSDHIIAFKKIVEEEGSAFAFPSRSLYLEKTETPFNP
ncbi:mechanosensitive ion channel family protein [Terasakiella sp. A23]|uniref:mechanosensitive ion channel family protein n=1 Tax=Terasakiella sp. FCG-A23 TaxID=3080561 RepID=UPI00295474F2|nr:mechanosensitive ion channel family protein [Terasakiella sp. A23]MDV7339395.1 mechanosensitive ion channel family protein [Terasakiella sp. A23]